MALVLKKSVRPDGLRPELLLGLMVAAEVYRELGVDCVVTSVNDSQHSDASLHYLGVAADLRTHQLTPLQRPAVAATIAERLPEDYDVLLEGTDADPNQHVHLEYQPRWSNR